MRISLVTYRKTFNLGSFQSESIGVEMELNEGDNATEALDNCAALVDEYHVKTLANLDEFRGTSTRDIGEIQEKEQPKALVEQILSCTELKVLESYRLIAKTTPECQEAYDNKLKELKND